MDQITGIEFYIGGKLINGPSYPMSLSVVKYMDTGELRMYIEGEDMTPLEYVKDGEIVTVSLGIGQTTTNERKMKVVRITDDGKLSKIALLHIND